MKQVRNIKDLEQFGFIVLTSDMCPMKLRTCFQLTGNATNIIEYMFRTQLDDEGWGNDPDTIHLPNSMLNDLAVFCMFYQTSEISHVIVTNKTVVGFTKDEFDTTHLMYSTAQIITRPDNL